MINHIEMMQISLKYINHAYHHTHNMQLICDVYLALVAPPSPASSGPSESLTPIEPGVHDF